MNKLLLCCLFFLSGCTMVPLAPNESHAQMKKEGLSFWQRNPYIPGSAIIEGLRQFSE